LAQCPKIAQEPVRMAFRAGQSGNPSGRPKGSRNRLTLEVIDRLQSLGCDPIEGMAKIAMDENTELSLRVQMYKELAQYVAPKRKAVEMKADLGLTWIDVLKEVNAVERQAKANQSGAA
jgi:hypothetical protein